MQTSTSPCQSPSPRLYYPLEAHHWYFLVPIILRAFQIASTVFHPWISMWFLTFAFSTGMWCKKCSYHFFHVCLNTEHRNGSFFKFVVSAYITVEWAVCIGILCFLVPPRPASLSCHIFLIVTDWVSKSKNPNKSSSFEFVLPSIQQVMRTDANISGGVRHCG